MTTILKSILILLLVFFDYSVYSQDQELSKNSIKVGFGLGISSGAYADGHGLIYTIGYQRGVWKNRLRLNPNFSIGHYSSKFVYDAPDQFFNSINIEANVYLDLIRIKSFSLVLGCGGLINNTRGLTGTGGDIIRPPSSEYISSYHIAGYLGAGFRIDIPSRRTAINIMPINIHAGNNFLELYAKIELDIKLWE